MAAQRKVLSLLFGWLVLVTVLHLWLNTKAFDPGSWRQERAEQSFRVGFLPVT